MSIGDFFWQFYRDVRVRKLRIVLAVGGIAWGTAAVVLLATMSDAIVLNVRKSIRGMGQSMVFFEPLRTTKAFQGMKPGRPVLLKSADVIRMGEALPEIDLYSPELVHLENTIGYGDNRTNTSVSGVTPEYRLMRNIVPQLGGRFLNQRDVVDRRHVIFLGDELVEKLFSDREAVGEWVLVDGRHFLVVGVSRKKLQPASYYFGPDAGRAFIPYTTFIGIWGDWNLNYFLLRPQRADDSTVLKKAVSHYFGAKLRFDPKDTAAIRVSWDTTEITQFTKFVFWALQGLFALGALLILGSAVSVCSTSCT